MYCDGWINGLDGFLPSSAQVKGIMLSHYSNYVPEQLEFAPGRRARDMVRYFEEAMDCRDRFLHPRYLYWVCFFAVCTHLECRWLCHRYSDHDFSRDPNTNKVDSQNGNRVNSVFQPRLLVNGIVDLEQQDFAELGRVCISYQSLQTNQQAS